MAPNTRGPELPEPEPLENYRLPVSLKLLEGEENVPKCEKKEILYDGYFYDVTNFIDRHPGGGIIKFYAQSKEDATLSIQQFHARVFPKVTGIMKQFKRRLPYPSECQVIDLKEKERQENMTKDFVELYHQLKSEGYFEPSLTYTSLRLLELAVIGLLGTILLMDTDKSFFGTVVGIICFALFGARSGLVGHEAGHRSLTGKPKTDALIHAIVYGVGAGLSGSCWNSHHNAHHDMPQRVDRDHDLRTMPIIALNEKHLENSAAKSVHIKYQAFLSLTLDTFLILLYWKFYSHPLYAWRKGKWTELLCMCVHFLWSSIFIGFWPWVFSVYLGSIYLFGNYALSHSHLPVTEGPLHWVEYALIHTQNINDHWLTNWWMSFLNFQVEHHFFPTMPQFRNRLVKGQVQAIAAKYNIPYLCDSYKNIAIECFQNLHRVSELVKAEAF